LQGQSAAAFFLSDSAAAHNFDDGTVANGKSILSVIQAVKVARQDGIRIFMACIPTGVRFPFLIYL
jgi:hypothetical protein